MVNTINMPSKPTNCGSSALVCVATWFRLFLGDRAEIYQILSTLLTHALIIQHAPISHHAQARQVSWGLLRLSRSQQVRALVQLSSDYLKLEIPV